MKRNTILACLIGGVLTVSASNASAQLHEGDIIVDISPWGQIRTGDVDTVSGQANMGVRVFDGWFGKQPNFTNDPGYDTLLGTFQPGELVGFNIRSALRVWNGDDFSTIADERVQFRFAQTLQAMTPETDVWTEGFKVSVPTDGKWHRHIGMLLLGPADGQGGFLQPSDGVYLLHMELDTTQSGVIYSQPYWLIMNQNRPTQEVIDAKGWVRDNFLPSPDCPADMTGSTSRFSPQYGVPDGAIDSDDFFYFLSRFSMGSLAEADLTGSATPGDPAYGVPDGVVDADDFFYFLQKFAAGCP